MHSCLDWLIEYVKYLSGILCQVYDYDQIYPFHFPLNNIWGCVLSAVKFMLADDCENICSFYFHHQIKDNTPLFMIMSCNNGMRCMAY